MFLGARNIMEWLSGERVCVRACVCTCLVMMRRSCDDARLVCCATWHVDCAWRVAASGRPVAWTTPLGLRVVQVTCMFVISIG
jgi:hypothetical protein